MLNIARCALMKVSLDASLWVVANATLHFRQMAICV